MKGLKLSIVFIFCIVFEVNCVGRPAQIDRQSFLDACAKFKEDIIRPDGLIASKSSNVWLELQEDLGGKLKASSLYTKVSSNCFGVLDLLRNGKNDLMPGFDSESDVDSETETSEKFETSEESISEHEVGDTGRPLAFEFHLTREEFDSMTQVSYYNRRSRKTTIKRSCLTFKKFEWESVIRKKIWEEVHYKCKISFKNHNLSNRGESGKINGTI